MYVEMGLVSEGRVPQRIGKSCLAIAIKIRTVRAMLANTGQAPPRGAFPVPQPKPEPAFATPVSRFHKKQQRAPLSTPSVSGISPTQTFHTPYDFPSVALLEQSALSPPTSPLTSPKSRPTTDNTADLLTSLIYLHSNSTDKVVLKDAEIRAKCNGNGADVDINLRVKILVDGWSSTPVLQLPFLLRSFSASVSTSEDCGNSPSPFTAREIFVPSDYDQAHATISNSLLTILSRGKGYFLFRVKVWVPFTMDEKRIFLAGLPQCLNFHLTVPTNRSQLIEVEPSHLIVNVAHSGHEAEEKEPQPFADVEETATKYHLIPTDNLAISWVDEIIVDSSSWNTHVALSPTQSGFAKVTSSLAYTLLGGSRIRCLDLNHPDISMNQLQNLSIQGIGVKSWAFVDSVVSDLSSDFGLAADDENANIFRELPPDSMIDGAITKKCDSRHVRVEFDEKFSTSAGKVLVNYDIFFDDQSLIVPKLQLVGVDNSEELETTFGDCIDCTVELLAENESAAHYQVIYAPEPQIVSVSVNCTITNLMDSPKAHISRQFLAAHLKADFQAPESCTVLRVDEVDSFDGSRIFRFDSTHDLKIVKFEDRKSLRVELPIDKLYGLDLALCTVPNMTMFKVVLECDKGGLLILLQLFMFDDCLTLFFSTPQTTT